MNDKLSFFVFVFNSIFLFYCKYIYKRFFEDSTNTWRDGGGGGGGVLGSSGSLILREKEMELAEPKEKGWSLW